MRARPPLPTRDGVGPSRFALPPGPYLTIAQCLVARFPGVDAAEWAARITAGEVVDQHGCTITAQSSHRPGLHVYYYRSLAEESEVPFEETVLYQDEHIVVADKPHFLAVTPSGSHLQQTLLVRLKRKLGIDTLAPVHRIDRETAGLVLFSVDPASRGRYQRLFAERKASKTYECIAPWRDLGYPLERASRLVDDPGHFMRVIEVAGEPNAYTRLDLLGRSGGLARYELTPLTGRRHQLRVQCAGLGMPIAGDRIYPTLMPPGTDDHARPLRLLARSLAFVDPITNTPRAFESLRRLEWPDTA